MRVLLDECVPRRLRLYLTGHDVQTVQAMGWSGKKNGELLRLLAVQGFDALITADRNIQYQQNLETGGPAVIVLVAESNRLRDLIPLVPALLTILASIRPGALVEVTRENQQGNEEK